MKHLTQIFEYDFFQYQFAGNSAYDWLMSLAIVVASLALCKLLTFVLSKTVKLFTSKTKTKLDDVLIEKFRQPMICAIILGGLWWAFSRLHVPARIDHIVGLIYRVAVVLNTTWFFAGLVTALIEQYLVPLIGKTGNIGHHHKIDIHIISIVQKTSNGLIWLLGCIMALNNAGVNVSALLAGLGIGGIAFALAAQDTVKNIFGGITIFTDKPFRIGDYVTIDGTSGTVEDIGMRSIRMRTDAGRLITIPNYKTVDNKVENITQEPARRIELRLGLTYDTSPQKMQQAMQILSNMPKSIAEIEEKVLVYFSSYGDFAMQLTCFYFIKKQSNLFETQSIVNLHVLTEFNNNKIEFAFPTQTILLNNS